MDNYIRPEEIIIKRLNKKEINWKSILFEVIEKNNIDPWDIDLKYLTKSYLNAIKEIKNIDFEVSGELLIVAVFLLKNKVEILLNKDLREIEDKINNLNNNENDLIEDLDTEDLEQINDKIDNFIENSKKEYKIKYRNPIARKRKVNIHDLIKVLEKTLEKSKKRRENILMRKKDIKYNGPNYHKKRKNFKELVDEIYEVIKKEFESKKSQISFSNLIKGKNKEEILNIFLPLLHLSNKNKIELNQKEHFREIYIKVNE